MLIGLSIIPSGVVVCFLASCVKREVAPLPTFQSEWPMWLLIWGASQVFVAAIDYLAGPGKP